MKPSTYVLIAPSVCECACFCATEGTKGVGGVQVTPIEKLRLNVGYHLYFDRDTRQWTKNLVKDTHEITLGAAYDLTDRIEVSAGYQKTMYDQSEANYSDLSFNLKLNAAYFQTNYSDHTVTTQVSNIIFHRENRVFGLGVDVNF